MTGTDTGPNIGAPVWVDLLSSDIETATRFYEGLFGWTADDPDPASGGYRIFRKDGAVVAGGMPLTVETEGQPSAWGVYIGVEDAEVVAASVRSEGGSVLIEPMDVMDLGRMAVFADPAGAVFSVWQPGTLPSAQMFNEPGSLSWVELQSRDPEGSKRFYTRIFGWSAKDYPREEYSYTEWYAHDGAVGGLLPMVGGQWPDEIPPHWMTYFAVEDCDAAAAKVAELGGQVPVRPFDIPPGRMAVVSDPTGTHFSIIALGGESGSGD